MRLSVAAGRTRVPPGTGTMRSPAGPITAFGKFVPIASTSAVRARPAGVS